ncbi:MAG: Rv3654c family TadE-like protein [Actinomycetes bacterium]
MAARTAGLGLGPCLGLGHGCGAHRACGDRGSASLWVLAFATAVLFVGVAGLGMAVVLVDRVRAASAADLAALSAAAVLDAGPAVVCARAGAVSRANGAQLLECLVLPGPSAQVLVGVELPGALRRLGPVLGRVRAGPA